MPDPADRLDPAALAAALKDCRTAWRIEVRDACASSNTELLDAAGRGAGHGSVLVCERQSAGRGRRGRPWESVAGGSLTFSLIWGLDAAAAPPMGLSLAAGLALLRALAACGLDGVRLKWPNDLLAGEGKLAGILVELVSGGGGQPAAVIGIGINLALPPGFTVPGGLPACDLAGLTARPPGRQRLLAEILRALDATLTDFDRGGFAVLREAWMQHHAHTGAAVRVSGESATAVDGRCLGVDDEGALILDTAAGRRRILSGELSLRLAP